MPWSWVTGKQKSFRHRGAERHDTSSLHVPNLGELLDLSITGMRIKVAGKPKMDVKQVLPLIICNQGQCVKVTAQVVWVRKASLTGNEYQVGIRFMDVKPGIAKALDQLARFGCITPSAGMAASVMPSETTTSAPAASTSSTASTTSSATASTPPPSAPLITVEVEDLYANLGLAVGASEDQIRKAYHELAMKYHPDRSQEAGSEERFRMIAKTYLVLKDPEKRARYDAMLRGQAALHRAAATVSPEPAPAQEQRVDDMSDLMDESQRDAA
jgi:hypothetical protein